MRGRVSYARCKRCDRGIAAVPGDPIIHTSGGIFCARCNSELASAPPPTVKALAPVKKKSEAKANAARARWEAKSPEEKAAHVAKMQAARAKKKGEEATP